jgi:serine/threonine protein phosphatase PrpC
VTNVLSQDKLLEFLVKPVDPETIAKQILAKVNSLGAPDNATALVIQVN